MKRIPSQIRALQRLLDTGMRIDMIAEPLHSVDADAQAVEIAIVLEEHGFNECGVKRDGTVNEIVSRASLNKGTVGDHARPVPRERIVDAAAPLWSSLQPITQHGSLFVSGRHGQGQRSLKCYSQRIYDDKCRKNSVFLMDVVS